jgi:acyl-coenzyme A synthetase/AMP-(fatty) acid ligase
LRLFLSAGTALAPRVARRFGERLRKTIAIFYGTTETGPIAFEREPRETEEGLLPVGAPMEGVDVRLTGGAETGRVEVRSAAVALGYAPDPCESLSGGRFLTDDVARIDAEGRLVLIGRESRKIHVAGKKVQPEEVERVLCSLPGVRDALVLGSPRNESTEDVVALVVSEANGGCPKANELKDACRTRLSPHKVPRQVLLVERIPRTARGKVDLGAAIRFAASR